MQDIVVGALICLMAGLVLAGAVTQWSSPKGRPWFMLLLGLGPVFLGVAGMMVTGGRRQWSARTTRLYLAATGEAKDVAWVHLTVGSVNAMKVHFHDGEVATVHANRKDSARLLAFMAQRAPGAIFGFGPEQPCQPLLRHRPARAVPAQLPQPHPVEGVHRRVRVQREALRHRQPSRLLLRPGSPLRVRPGKVRIASAASAPFVESCSTTSSSSARRTRGGC